MNITVYFGGSNFRYYDISYLRTDAVLQIFQGSRVVAEFVGQFGYKVE